MASRKLGSINKSGSGRNAGGTLDVALEVERGGGGFGEGGAPQRRLLEEGGRGSRREGGGTPPKNYLYLQMIGASRVERSIVWLKRTTYSAPSTSCLPSCDAAP